jgi:hypothetical protein
LAIAILVLLGWSLTKIFKHSPAEARPNVKSLLGLVGGLLLADVFICLYFLVSAGLSHSSTAIRLANWKCLLSFFTIVVLPMLLLVHFRYLRRKSLKKKKFLSVGSIMVTLILILLLAAKSGGWPPYLCLLRNGYPNLANLMLKLGTDVDSVGPYGWTPLSLAVQRRDFELAQRLLENKADINFQHGAALKRAILLDDYKFTRWLLENGATPNVNSNYETPLSLAEKRGNHQLIEILLEHGATR